MALSKFGFIVTGDGLDPTVSRVEMHSDLFAMIAIGVSDVDQAILVAEQMLAEGVELLELCGGFGPLGTAAVLDAIDGVIPVGSVGYGPESIDLMYRLFSE